MTPDNMTTPERQFERTFTKMKERDRYEKKTKQNNTISRI